jgi:beta-lactamase regulating signal transducer with metallopeptidase domain
MVPMSDSWLWWVGARLLEGSAYGAVIVAVVWVVCRRIRAIPPSARALLWWLASLRLVVALLPLPSLGIAVLPPPTAVQPRIELPDTSGRVVDDPRPVTTAVPETTPDPALRLVVIGLVALWFGGVTLQAFQLCVGYIGLRRMVGRSRPIAPDEAEIVERLAGLVALRRVPMVRVSTEIQTPLVVGIVRPTVLLPAAEIGALALAEREMAICHELAHVRRRDLVLGWIPALAERLFFFHPLARLAAREYVAEREAACDALVVHAMDVAPRDYGQMLVRLGVGRFGPVFTATGSSPSTSSLRRRLDMLHDSTAARPRRGGKLLLAVLAMAVVVPLQFTARTLQSPEPATQAAPVPRPVQRVPARPVAVPAQPTVAPPQVPAVPAPRSEFPADEKQLREVVAHLVAQQRDQMGEIERALAILRREFEETLARAEKIREPGTSNAAQRATAEQMQAVAEQERANRAGGRREPQTSPPEPNTPQDEMRKLVEQRQALVRTQQMLEERLRTLIIEQETIDRRLRELGDEINGVRQPNRGR